MIEGTFIAMMDGSHKPIEELKVGDEVQGVEGKVVVEDIEITEVREFAVINGEVPLTLLTPLVHFDGDEAFMARVADRTDANPMPIATIGYGLCGYADMVSLQTLEFFRVDAPLKVYVPIAEEGTFYINGIAMGSWYPIRSERAKKYYNNVLNWRGTYGK